MPRPMLLDISPKEELFFEGKTIQQQKCTFLNFNSPNFVGPYSRPVKVSLFLVNDTDQRIAFKIKTTIRDRYKVTPVKDILSPGSRATVNIVFSALFGPRSSSSDLSAFFAEKHKFLVEAAIASGSDNAIEKILNLARSKGSIMEARIRCVFQEDYLLNPQTGHSESAIDHQNSRHGGLRHQQTGFFADNLIFNDRSINFDNPLIFYAAILLAVLLFYFLFFK